MSQWSEQKEFFDAAFAPLADKEQGYRGSDMFSQHGLAHRRLVQMNHLASYEDGFVLLVGAWARVFWRIRVVVVLTALVIFGTDLFALFYPSPMTESMGAMVTAAAITALVVFIFAADNGTYIDCFRTEVAQEAERVKAEARHREMVRILQGSDPEQHRQLAQLYEAALMRNIAPVWGGYRLNDQKTAGYIHMWREFIILKVKLRGEEELPDLMERMYKQLHAVFKHGRSVVRQRQAFFTENLTSADPTVWGEYLTDLVDPETHHTLVQTHADLRDLHFSLTQTGDNIPPLTTGNPST